MITRLKQAVSFREGNWERRILKKELAQAAGVTSAAVTNWWKNETTELEAKCIFGLSGFLDINPEWLQSGKGSMLDAGAMHNSAPIDKKSSEASRNYLGGLRVVEGATLGEEELPRPTEEEFAFVPQLDIAAACGNGRFEDHVVVKGGLAFKKSFLRDRGVPEHAARIIYASGGSMSPTLQDGCVVLLNLADTEPRDGKVYAICKPDDGLVLKRLIWDFHPAVGRQTWIMRSDNPDKIAHPDKLLPPDDRTMIAGRAVWNDNQL